MAATSSSSPAQQDPASSSGPPFRLPKLTVFKFDSAWNSPQVDERCITYCSQTAGGRARGKDPKCRTVCWRKVFGHEVPDGSYDASNDVNGYLKPDAPLPLPHEGQPSDAIVDGAVVENEHTRHWREGHYFWTTKSRWVGQEKLDLMMSNLGAQTEWMRFKELTAKQHAEEEMDRLRNQAKIARHPPEERAEAQDDESDFYGAPAQHDSPSWQLPPSAPDNLRSYPDNSTVSKVSYLLPLSPPHTLLHKWVHDRLTFILTPTSNLMGMFYRTIEDGSQLRFLHKAYEKATDGSTFILLRNALARHRELWKDSEERRGKGGDDGSSPGLG